MDHKEAIQEGFAERYLLSELTPAQREQFEEHFFDCAICSADVEAGAVFVDNARAVLRAEESFAATAPVFAKFGIPFRSAAFLSVCLAALVVYQNVVTIPAMRSGASGSRSAAMVSFISLVGMGSRAESQPVVIHQSKEIVMTVDVPSGPDFASYYFEVLDEKKKARVNIPIPADKANDVVTLSVPGSDLPPGNYEIVVVGKRASGPLQELSRSTATVK